MKFAWAVVMVSCANGLFLPRNITFNLPRKCSHKKALKQSTEPLKNGSRLLSELRNGRYKSVGNIRKVLQIDKKSILNIGLQLMGSSVDDDEQRIRMAV